MKGKSKGLDSLGNMEDQDADEGEEREEEEEEAPPNVVEKKETSWSPWRRRQSCKKRRRHQGPHMMTKSSPMIQVTRKL